MCLRNRELLFLYLRMRLRRRLHRVSPMGVSSVRGVKFDFNLDLCGEMYDMAQGYYELDTLSIMRRYLKPGGLFLDVGSNVGYFSAIGLGLVGTRGTVHAFEPVPKYAEHLDSLACMNPDYALVVNRFAAGAEAGTEEIVLAKENIGGNTLIPGLLSEDEAAEREQVEVRRLDEYILTQDLTNIQLIKIDTEGFEYLVLQGLSHYFDSAKLLPPIIVELTTKAYELMGTSLSELDASLREWGYDAYRIRDYGLLSVTNPGFRCGNLLLLPR